jgi:hypothetical protein
MGQDFASNQYHGEIPATGQCQGLSLLNCGNYSAVRTIFTFSKSEKTERAEKPIFVVDKK